MQVTDGDKLYHKLLDVLDETPIGSQIDLEEFINHYLPCNSGESIYQYAKRCHHKLTELVKRCRSGIDNHMLPANMTLDFVLTRIAESPEYALMRHCEELDPNAFADLVGRKILAYCGCLPDDIHITPDGNDNGIDYWGVFRSRGLTPILIVGQVKQYCGNVGQPYLQAFSGAVDQAVKSGMFPADCHAAPQKQFVVGGCGGYTTQARKAAEILQIQRWGAKELQTVGIDLTIAAGRKCA